MSVNRSKFSSPEDTLTDHKGVSYENYGIICFSVNEVCSIKLDHPEFENKAYVFTVEHKPLPCNYAHSEMPVLLEENIQTEIKSKRVKTELRKLLQDLVTEKAIIKRPKTTVL